MTVMQRLNWLWRLWATALAYLIFGLFGILLSLLLVPILMLYPGGEKKRQQRTRYVVHRLFLAFVHLTRLLGLLRWDVQGLESLKRRSGLVLANHPTLLDVVFLIAFIPNANCVVKSRLWQNPAISSFIRLTGYIANDQGPALIESARTALQEGSMLIVFPEGTRTRKDSSRELKLQRGAANIAVRCQQDIIPVIIQCDPPTLSKEHKWYHIPARRFVMSFQVKDDILVADYVADPAALGARKLNRYLHNYFTRESQFHVS